MNQTIASKKRNSRDGIKNIWKNYAELRKEEGKDVEEENKAVKLNNI